ncbi:hypothetical protein [Tengunoibacter tsumagoiensis]|uniref:Uncharacterized protein n=1 Tax=Tengunoibacter tsumagoiensis TaxID=2014871 RepID=A0A401ZUE7_9CHLR|nr:hypothetical protein [Tengunoibacter tsumagoiensis]GCE10578.1 hypothetical protein KTT_04370 [Tengunoibacter tsumagoiensis]
MSFRDLPLFTIPGQHKRAVGFHNIGSGVLRASHTTTIRMIESHYGARCGHIPLNACEHFALVTEHTLATSSHIAYLSRLLEQKVQPITGVELASNVQEEPPLIVPYINTPETERYIQQDLAAQSWGLPSSMVHILKNKADFYQLLDELQLEGFQVPDYTVAVLPELVPATLRFLAGLEDLLHEVGMTDYPSGVVIRGAESDGNYGCVLLSEYQQKILAIVDGDGLHPFLYPDWATALQDAQTHLEQTIDPFKEPRIVISRMVDVLDSPGLSLVLHEQQVASLGWNGQLQRDGSKACAGTSSYVAATPQLERWQAEYEELTALFLEKLLRCTAQRCGIDVATITGLANLDIILPGPQEQHLQKLRGLPPLPYLAECNPRWTNYTDAIMTVIGAQQRPQTISSMQAVIREGIFTYDKYVLPAHCDPYQLRDRIAERDAQLKQQGTRIICRMPNNPMGLILAGNLVQAEQELSRLVGL